MGDITRRIDPESVLDKAKSEATTMGAQDWRRLVASLAGRLSHNVDTCSEICTSRRREARTFRFVVRSLVGYLLVSLITFMPVFDVAGPLVGGVMAADSTVAGHDGNAQRTNTDSGNPPGTTDTAVATASAEQLHMARQELEVKHKELEVRLREVDKAAAIANSPWWRRADPLLLAIIGAMLTIFGNMLVSYFNNVSTVAQEMRKSENDLALEKLKAKYTLILQAIATNDPKSAERNINFFIGAGLLDDADGRIHSAIAQFSPVLPSPAGTVPLSTRAVAVSEIARLYNFPADLDGTGQVIGLLELSGGYHRKDLDTYFAENHLTSPSVTAISVNGAKNRPGSDADGQVLSDIQITGTIAPKSAIRVYFTNPSVDGWVNAIERASADQVSVLLIGWGQPESSWKDGEVSAINAALEIAAKSGVTIICAAGERGVTDGVGDAGRHVDFPSSSPWVLSVGGTSLSAASHSIESEVVWNEGDQGATGGGVSDHFDRPDWQEAIAVPRRQNGKMGRGVPDVAATAWNTMPIIRIHGSVLQIGGTTVAAAVWAGLIPLINQGLGRNVGYLNPLLYREIGPAGVLRPVSMGNNSVDGVVGYQAGLGWSPAAGWGTPDGVTLLDWLRKHR